MSRDTIIARPAMPDLFLHPASSPTRGKDRRPRSGAEGLQSRSPGARDEEKFWLVSAVDKTVKPQCPRDESGNHPSIRASMGHGFVWYSEGAYPMRGNSRAEAPVQKFN
jgi:hypothetical protein